MLFKAWSMGHAIALPDTCPSAESASGRPGPAQSSSRRPLMTRPRARRLRTQRLFAREAAAEPRATCRSRGANPIAASSCDARPRGLQRPARRGPQASRRLCDTRSQPRGRPLHRCDEVGPARRCRRRSAAHAPRRGDRSAALGPATARQHERGAVGRSRPWRRSPTARRRLRASPPIGDVHGAGSIRSPCCAGATSTRLVFVPSRSTARPCSRARCRSVRRRGPRGRTREHHKHREHHNADDACGSEGVISRRHRLQHRFSRIVA